MPTFCIFVLLLFCIITFSTVAAQRPFYAGSRPRDGLSQKDKYRVTQQQLNPNTYQRIESRFGVAKRASDHLPIDARGDRVLVTQLSRRPVDKQPFWFINYKAIEAQRNGIGVNYGGPVASRSFFLG